MEAYEGHSEKNWSNPVKLMVWGYFLFSTSLQWYYLQYILPVVGLLLMFGGTLRLRKENAYFTKANYIVLVLMVKNLLDLALASTPVGNNMVVTLLFAFVSVILGVLWLLFLRSAFKDVFTKAGVQANGDPYMYMVVYIVAMFIAAILQLTGLLYLDNGVLLLAAVNIYILVLMGRVGKQLDATEYRPVLAQGNAKHYDGIRAKAVYWVFPLLCLAIALSCSLYTSHNKLDVVEFVAAENTEARAALLDLGFPAEVLNDLSNEDIAPMSGMVDLQYYSEALVFDRNGWQVEVTPEQLATNDLPGRRSVKATVVFVRRQDDTMYVVQHFRWVNGGAFWLDGINIQHSEDLTNQYALKGGRMLYTKDGQAYAASYPMLDIVKFTHDDIFDQTNDKEIFAAVNFPMGAEDQRGYIVYSEQLQSDTGGMTNSLLNYYHCTLPLNLPYLPMEQRVVRQGLPACFELRQFYMNYPHVED